MKISLPGRGNLYYSAFVASLASFTIGTHYSWSSPTIPKLEAPDSFLPINSEDASWIGSLTSLGTALGPFLGGALINNLGRRWTVMIAIILSTIAWLILLFSTALWELYVGRFVAGVGGGIVFMACPTYVAEIAEPAVRGMLGPLFSFFLVGGYLVEYVLGPYISYTALIIVNLVPAVVFVLLFPLMPESPIYYLRKNDRDNALEKLTWLRAANSNEDVQRELTEMETEVRRSMAEKANWSDLVATRGNRKGLVIALAMMSGQQFSGANVVQFYAQNIFIMAGSSFSSSISSILIGAANFIFGGFTPVFARLFGMKNLLIFSAIGMAFFQLILGLYFYFYSAGADLSSWGWLPVVSLFMYMVTYTLGFGPLPWAVMAEVFPSNVKGLATAISASFCWIVSFLLTKFFDMFSQAFGAYSSFFFFAVCCVLSLIFTIFFVPDTRGMSLQEILDLLENGPSVKNHQNGTAKDKDLRDV